jgi:hypothetical protein
MDFLSERELPRQEMTVSASHGGFLGCTFSGLLTSATNSFEVASEDDPLEFNGPSRLGESLDSVVVIELEVVEEDEEDEGEDDEEEVASWASVDWASPLTNAMYVFVPPCKAAMRMLAQAESKATNKQPEVHRSSLCTVNSF